MARATDNSLFETRDMSKKQISKIRIFPENRIVGLSS